MISLARIVKILLKGVCKVRARFLLRLNFPSGTQRMTPWQPRSIPTVRHVYELPFSQRISSRIYLYVSDTLSVMKQLSEVGTINCGVCLEFEGHPPRGRSWKQREL